MEKEKRKLRTEILRLRDAQEEREILRKSSLIEANLLSLAEFSDARTIMFYVSKGSEVHTHKLIKDALKMEKGVVVPFCVDQHHKIIPSRIESFDELKEGDFGVLQPDKRSVKETDPSGIDVFIIPGTVFDHSGHRLGWGRGFYDRFLEKSTKDKLKIGLAFDFQVVKEVPREKHDIYVDIVVTEKEVRRISGKRSLIEDR